MVKSEKGWTGGTGEKGFLILFLSHLYHFSRVSRHSADDLFGNCDLVIGI
jgi:hypothetical protein